MPDPAAAAPEHPAPRRPRRRRRALIALGLLALTLAAGAFVLTRSSVLVAIVRPRLEAALGADVRIDHAAFEGRSVLAFRGVRASAPGVPGPPGEILTVERVTARLDWSALLTGRLAIRDALFEQPSLRLSRDLDRGVLNLAALAPRARSGAPADLPCVRVRDASIEYGEHSGQDYGRLAALEVDGELRRSRSTPGRYEFSLVESDQSAADRAPANPIPLTLEGEYDPLAVEGALTLRNVDLASWGPSAAPSAVRDLWTQIALEGRVAQTELIYSDARGVEARFRFEHVGLTLPVAADPQADLDANPGPRAEPARYMRLSDAAGVATLGRAGLQAEIAGRIEDLPYRVEVNAQSLDLDAPFTIRFETAEPFSVAERPQLLPFAPTIVRERFRSFSGPTAMLEAVVVATRAEPTPDGPAPVRIAGEITFAEGEAAYESFPYTFGDMAGRVRFDDDAIHIEEITGRSASGATLRAVGVIAPPVDGAQVAINIDIRDIPLDDAFNAAMPASRADLLGTLFNRSAERRLREKGLLTDEFTLGGVGALDIRVRRPLGEDSRWDWNATLTLLSAGLIVDQFPYPIIAEQVTVQVWDERAEVVIPLIRGLGGGDGDLRAWITLQRGDQSVFSPVIMVRAKEIPVDERLLCALPARPLGAGDAPAPADILRALALRGTVDTISRVLPRDDSDEIGFDVTLEFEGLSALAADAEPPTVRDLAGRVEVSETGVRVHELRGRLGVGAMSITGDLGYDAATRPTSLDLVARSIDLRDPFERLVAAFAPDAAQRIRRGVDGPRLTGMIDADVALTQDAGDDAIGVRAILSNLRDVSLDALGARVGLEDVTGALTLTMRPDDGVGARFDAFEASLLFADAPPARVTFDGALDLAALEADDAGERAEGSAPAAARSLNASAALAWPSPLTEALLRRAAPDRAGDVAAFLKRWGIAVEANLSATVESSSAGLEFAGVAIAPRSIAIERDGAATVLDVESGALTFDAGRIEIDGLTLRNETIRATIEGDAVTGAAPSVDLFITGSAAPFDTGARALLPGELRRVLDDAHLSADRLDIDRAQIAVSSETTLEASLRYDGLSLDLGGASIADASGALDLRIDTADARPLDARLAFDHARVQRIQLDEGAARIVVVDGGATLVVPEFDAGAYGGRVFGVARLARRNGSLLAGRERGAPLTYEVEGALSGLSFDALRHDLRVEGDEDETPPTDRGGTVDATIAVAGVVGSPRDRVGRGAVRVWGGEILRLPLAGPLIELSNLQLPTAEEIDFAQATFFIEGDVVDFQELGVASRSVNLDGDGTLRWPSLGLDLRVTSRGVRRAPILSDLVEAFRNELIVSRVTGTLADPQFTVETLPSTRRFLDSIFGRPNDRPRPARPAARPLGNRASTDDGR